ncbi:MAG: L,D-transpeptidase family protein [Beijerinckiaceae bacterium]|nr:L,D-transpeptidase family protein [Beijerinckiaceae bacterium]
MLSGSVVSAQVRGNPFRNQAEWTQRYDADARLRVRRIETPLLTQQTIVGTQQAIQQYQQIVARGGWGTVPQGRTLKLGSRGGAVAALRARLVASGDLGGQAASSQTYDSYVEAGVRRFQSRHGISTTGVASRQTLKELNVPVDARLRQLELNLVRLRSYSGDLGSRHVIMNIPAATVETVENGRIMTHHVAGVGKIDRQSPIMQARALAVNFNPFWTVPASIIRKDLIPKMQKDPNYLTENKIRIFDRAGTEIQPQQVNWNSMEATKYCFRQDSGGDINSLGFVRIDIANKHGVYMHDTPSKGIFGDDYRFVSSGCVRVQNVRDFVAWLLKSQGGWDRDRIDEAIRSGKQETIRLSPNVPVYWVYVTAWANDGIVQFRDDVYRRDQPGGEVAQKITPKPAQLR